MTSKAHTDMENLYRFYYRPLCLYALHYLGDEMLVEDIVQDCFIKFWEKSKTENIVHPKQYLYTMVRNASLDALRRMPDNHESLQTIESQVACLSKNSNTDQHPSPLLETLPDDQFQQDSFIEARLWTAIDSLPARCRRVFLMAKRDGKSYEEISDELKISTNTVRNQVSKALKILRDGAEKIILHIFSIFG